VETVTNVIKTTKSELISFCVEKYYLDRLITNLKLYKKDLDYINEYIDLYNLKECDSFLPSSEGIIFIDMINNIILDSQGITGVNKITPSEIKRSKNGKIPNETIHNSVFQRFIKLFDAGYLKGFDEWCDNGHKLNTNVLKLDYNDLIDIIMENGYNYGQFVFSTKPFKVETFNEIDWFDQKRLFEKAKKLKLIPKERYDDWNIYLKGLEK